MPRVVVEHGDFLDATKCTRCGESLPTRTKSFFTGETLGPNCMIAEGEIKTRILNRGLCLDKFRNCGYIPSASNNFKKPDKKRKNKV